MNANIAAAVALLASMPVECDSPAKVRKAKASKGKVETGAKSPKAKLAKIKAEGKGEESSSEERPAYVEPPIYVDESRVTRETALQFLADLQAPGAERLPHYSYFAPVGWLPPFVPLAEVEAINRFVGYSAGRWTHGLQLDNARRLANAAIRPVKAAVQPYKAGVSVAGFIAGIPDYIEKAIADLRGRERSTLDTMSFLLTKINDLSLPREERDRFDALCEVEAARCDAIRQDLARLLAG